MNADELRDENDQLRALLREVEWVQVASDTVMCPICCGTVRQGRRRHSEDEGHTDTCRLAKALAEEVVLR